MSLDVTLSYVVPVHNEAPILRASVARIVERLRRHPGSEILLVENGSTDGSPELVHELVAELEGNGVGIRATHSPKGIGNALRKGMSMAACELVVLTAADLPFGFSDLDNALVMDPRPSLAIGSKAHRNSVVRTDVLRRLASTVFGALRRALLHLEVGDSQGSIFLARPLVQRLLPHLSSEDYFISTEVVARSASLGATPVEVPVIYTDPRPDSKVRPIVDGARMLKQLMWLRRELRVPLV